MPSLPRSTPVHRRRQAVMDAATRRLLQRDDFWKLLVQAVQLQRAAVRHRVDHGVPDRVLEASGRLVIAQLAGLVKHVEPAYARLVGDDNLPGRIAALVGFRAMQLDDPEADVSELQQRIVSTGILARTMRISPDNPIEQHPDGSMRAPGDATPAQLLEWSDYRDSLELAGKPGRPRGSAKPKGSGRAPISEEAARDALILNPPTWATKHIPELDLSDPKQAEQARSRFRAARAHGQRLNPG